MKRLIFLVGFLFEIGLMAQPHTGPYPVPGGGSSSNYATNSGLVVNQGLFPWTWSLVSTNLWQTTSPECYVYIWGNSIAANKLPQYVSIFQSKFGVSGQGFQWQGNIIGNGYSTNDLTLSPIPYIFGGTNVVWTDSGGIATLADGVDVMWIAQTNAGIISILISTNAGTTNLFTTVSANATVPTLMHTNIALPRTYYRVQMTSTNKAGLANMGIPVFLPPVFYNHAGRGVVLLDGAMPSIHFSDYVQVPPLIMSNMFNIFKPRLLIVEDLTTTADLTANFQSAFNLFAAGYTNFDTLALSPNPILADSADNTNQVSFLRNWCLTNSQVFWDQHGWYGSFFALTNHLFGSAADSPHPWDNGRYSATVNMFEDTGLSALLNQTGENNMKVVPATAGNDYPVGYDFQFPGDAVFVVRGSNTAAVSLQGPNGSAYASLRGQPGGTLIVQGIVSKPGSDSTAIELAGTAASGRGIIHIIESGGHGSYFGQDNDVGGNWGWALFPDNNGSIKAFAVEDNGDAHFYKGLQVNNVEWVTNGVASVVSNKLSLTSITLTGSPFNWTNTTTKNVFVIIDGGTAFSVAINGTTIQSSLASGLTAPLQPNEWTTITYTIAPTATWKPF